jgi:glycerol-3-phosphate O-acyltransferase
VRRGHHLAAAFYRNTIVHFFVAGSIAEVAMVHAAELEVVPDERLDAFWTEVDRLRHLLQFDFFFEQRERFRTNVDDELRGRLPDWEEQLADGVEPTVLLDKIQPLNAYAVLRPFIEAYLIVARALVRAPEGEQIERKKFVRRCLALGEQWVQQQRVRSPEAVSKHVFQPALLLAEHRGLLEAAPDVEERRRRFVEELADVARRIDIIEERTEHTAGRSHPDAPVER